MISLEKVCEVIKESSLQEAYKLCLECGVDSTSIKAFLSHFSVKSDINDALVSTAHNFYVGKGVTKDYSAAANIYRLAAKYGDAKAQYNLAGMYYNVSFLQPCVIHLTHRYRKVTNFCRVQRILSID